MHDRPLDLRQQLSRVEGHVEVVESPVHARRLHRVKFIDYQLRRLVGCGFADPAKLEAALAGVRRFEVVAFEGPSQGGARLIAPVYDWLAKLPRFARRLVLWMVGFRRLMNPLIRLRMRLFPMCPLQAFGTKPAAEGPSEAAYWVAPRAASGDVSGRSVVEPIS